MNKGADPMSYDNSGHHYSDCTGPGGCHCDERRYGYRGGGGGGAGRAVAAACEGSGDQGQSHGQSKYLFHVSFLLILSFVPYILLLILFLIFYCIQDTFTDKPWKQ